MLLGFLAGCTNKLVSKECDFCGGDIEWHLKERTWIGTTSYSQKWAGEDGKFYHHICAKLFKERS